MGEVYKGRDTRLDRVVAIKVLSANLASDPQFRERFDREARAISRLTHPHVCTLYDIGEQAGTAFLVMEFLEGETLADRLSRGRSEKSAVPVDEALRLAIQMADALAAAHHKGIIHRDLKPGNVMLTRSGAKLLDFGLARISAAAVATSSLSMLPTTPPEPLTAQGTIMGTFQYMAPEQIDGAEADARTDIFAFGSLLYEMLTGKRAFEAKTQASLIAAILEREPQPITALQPLAPSLVDSIVRRCLAKNVDDRWQSAADLCSALRWAADSANGAVGSPAAAVPQPTRNRTLRGVVAAGVVSIVAMGVLVGWRYLSRPTVPAATLRFEVAPPPDATFSPAPVASSAQLALSPNGRHLAFVATPTRGRSQIWLRPLGGVIAEPLPGTEGGTFPFWSPDSRDIAFYAGGKLKKIDIAGGAPQTLADAVGRGGGAWSPDDVILFSQPNSAISRVGADGGAVTAATALDPEQAAVFHYWPQFLPDGKHFLYYQNSLKPEHQGIYVATLDSLEATRVIASNVRAVHASGHLLYVRDGMLFAQPFDDAAFRVFGEPARVADGVGYYTASYGYSAVTASADGILAVGPNVALTTSLQWRDRGGTMTGSVSTPRVYMTPRLSPDQKSVAVTLIGGPTELPDVWVLELSRGTGTRTITDPSSDWYPVWSPDGGRLFFGSNRTGATAIFEKIGVGPDQVFAKSVPTSGFSRFPSDMSSDGRFLAYFGSTTRNYDLGVFTVSGDRQPESFLSTPFNEVQGRFSPNGRWMAYASDESGRFEVYVRPFPAADGQWPVSLAGGMQPEWRRDGKELYFISADGRMMAVAVTTDGATFTADVPHPLFEVMVPEARAPYPSDYAVTADGQRFLVNTVVDQPSRPALTVILNWTAELKR
jgi:Tol biopolymer transport system component